MADTLQNGLPPPHVPMPMAQTQVIENLDLRDLFIERGTTGLRRASGFLREELLQDLAGLQGMRIYREMRDNSAVVGACLFAIEMLIRKVEWRLQPADESMKAEECADLVKGMLFEDLDMPWSMVLTEILTMLPFGFCLPGEQIVLRGNGIPVPIQDIKDGDMVLTQQGRPRRVLHAVTRPCNAPLIVLRLQGYPFPIRLTPEHRVPTRLGWKQARELQCGDELLRPRVPLTPGGDYESGWLVGAYLAEGHRRSDSKIGITFSVHRKEAEELKQRLDAWVSLHAENLLGHVRDLAAQGLSWRAIAKHTGHTSTTIRRWLSPGAPGPRNADAHICFPTGEDHRYAARVALARPEFRQLIDTWVTHGDARTKALRELPTQHAFAQGVLDGWIWGDGHDKVHHGKRSASGTTVSPALAMQMQLIAGSLGLPSPLSFRSAPRTPIRGRPSQRTDCLEAFHLSIIPHRQVIWKRTEAQQAYIETLRQSGLSMNAIHQQTGLAWGTVKKWLTGPSAKFHANQCHVYPDAIGHTIATITHEPYEGLVYDLEVEEDHTFCAGPVAVSNSFFEMIFKRRQGSQPVQQLQAIPYMPSRFDDGLIGLGKLAPRAQDTVLRWEFDHWGSLMGMHQLDPFLGRQAYLPYEKCLLFRPTSWKDSPEGRSILRTAYRSYYMTKNLENVEGIGHEREATGLPVIYVPAQWMAASATEAESAQLEMIKRIGRNVRMDEQACLVLPTLYDTEGHKLLEFLLQASPGRRSNDLDKTIQRYELRMAQSMLADLIFLGHEAVGSFALASSKTNILSMALSGYLMAIADVFNRRCLPLLWSLNGMPEALMPTLTHGDVESVDLKELGQFIKDYSGAGFDISDLDDHVRLLAGFPEREGEPLETPQKPSGQPQNEEEESTEVQKRQLWRRSRRGA